MNKGSKDFNLLENKTREGRLYQIYKLLLGTGKVNWFKICTTSKPDSGWTEALLPTAARVNNRQRA